MVYFFFVWLVLLSRLLLLPEQTLDFHLRARVSACYLRTRHSGTADYLGTRIFGVAQPGPPPPTSFFCVLAGACRFVSFARLLSREQVPDDLRESLGVAEAPEFDMLSKGGVFMQSDEVG